MTLALAAGLLTSCEMVTIRSVLKEHQAGGGSSVTYPIGLDQAFEIARTVPDNRFAFAVKPDRFPDNQFAFPNAAKKEPIVRGLPRSGRTGTSRRTDSPDGERPGHR